MIADALRGRTAYLDANVLIYFLQRDPDYFDAAASVLRAAADGEVRAVTGDAVVAEVMVMPYRSKRPEVVQAFRAFFASSAVVTVGHTAADFDRAAELRAETGAGLVDALHVATAARAGCSVLLTNDRRMPAVPGVEVIQLSGRD